MVGHQKYAKGKKDKNSTLAEDNITNLIVNAVRGNPGVEKVRSRSEKNKATNGKVISAMAILGTMENRKKCGDKDKDGNATEEGIRHSLLGRRHCFGNKRIIVHFEKPVEKEGMRVTEIGEEFLPNDEHSLS